MMKTIHDTSTANTAFRGGSQEAFPLRPGTGQSALLAISIQHHIENYSQSNLTEKIKNIQTGKEEENYVYSQVTCSYIENPKEYTQNLL